jgi:tRNA A58 N-methylase Trm61
MAATKKPSPAQLAARAKFTAMVKAKAAARKKAAKKDIPDRGYKKITLDMKPIKKISGLDKVVRRGKKTSVYYSRVSGIEKTIAGLQKKYWVIYETPTTIISDGIFNASSLKEAKSYAQFHKKMTPEIRKVKNVRVRVKLYK